jgi:hypothetical protein
MRRGRGGVEYEDATVGTGATAARGARVQVRYNLFLRRGERVQRDQVAAFRLGQREVVAGLEYGVEGMRVGGERRIRVGPHLAYGARGVPSVVPANAVVEFHVVLLESETPATEDPIDALAARARGAFESDFAAAPKVTLRGGAALDSYATTPPFEAEIDAPSDSYLERYAPCGLAHLDAASWRHYLARLIDYALAHLDDPGSAATEALLWSLRPPDREPPRLGSLSAEQEAVVVAVLDVLAFDPRSTCQDLAMQVLEEYWVPGALYRRPPPEAPST